MFIKDLINYAISSGKDKWIHFAACLIIAMIAFAICYALGMGRMAAVPGIIVPAIVGITKELWDRKHGTAELTDLLADMIGIMVACIIMIIIVA